MVSQETRKGKPQQQLRGERGVVLAQSSEMEIGASEAKRGGYRTFKDPEADKRVGWMRSRKRTVAGVGNLGRETLVDIQKVSNSWDMWNFILRTMGSH